MDSSEQRNAGKVFTNSKGISTGSTHIKVHKYDSTHSERRYLFESFEIRNSIGDNALRSLSSRRWAPPYERRFHDVDFIQVFREFFFLF